MKEDRGLWIGVALGAPIVVIGVLDALGSSRLTHPAELARWVIGGIVVVDLVVIPIALLVGRALAGRALLRWALAASGILAVVAWPYVRGYGRDPNNPSLLPRSYGTGLVVTIAVVWAAAGAWWASEGWQRRRRRRHAADQQLDA
jgi:hypothetical protein